jgi:carbon storage regulator
MLVISRKRGEVVWIGDVAIRVCDAVGGKARLAIDAPADVKVLRDELRERIKAEKQEASVSE